jgi:hypothetical protein
VKIEKQIAVQAKPERVWGLLWQIERLAECIPGCSEVRIVEPQRTYTATVTERLGPFRVSFPLTIAVTELEAPRRLQVRASGADARTASNLRATLDLSLAERSDGGTTISIVTDLNVLGKLGALGHSVITRKAHENLERFGAALREELLASAPKPEAN